nr:retrovirus-related Pol polyprotein from transposon TNT 1-94 [Tanacetum cinerariifolium]
MAMLTMRASYDWSFQAEEEPTDYALMAFTSSSSSSSDNEMLASQTNDKTRLGYHTQDFTSYMFDCDEMFTFETDESLPAGLIYDSPTKPDTYLSHTLKLSAPIIKDWVSASEDDFEAEISQNAPSFVHPTDQVKTPRSSVKTVETSIPADNHKTAIPKPKSNGNRRNRKACFVCKSLDRLIKDYDFYEKQVAQTPIRNHAQRRNHQPYARMPLPNPQRHVVLTVVLTKSKLVPITAARPVTAVILKPLVTRLRQAKTVVTKPHSPPRRTINCSLSPKASTFPPKVTVAKALMMCDKKNSVLFTDTECLVLSSEFKLPDANQLLLRFPRGNNMYNVDLKNIVPSLTCLFAKATLGLLLPIPFWAEAVNTSCYVQNRVLVTKPQNKTPYELLLGRTPSIGFIRPFGYLVTILNTLDPLGKFDGKVDERFLVGYFNTDDDDAFGGKKPEFEGRKPEYEVYVSPSSSAQTKKHDDKTKREDKGKSHVESSTGYRNLSAEFEYFSDNSINKVNAADSPVPAVGQILTNSINTFSAAGPSNVAEELLQFKMQKVWVLVDLPHEKRAIGHTQEEGIDYEEVFATFVRIEAIRLFLAYASFMGFLVYQMDVKSAFLYGTIEEEVYVCQPPGFEDPDYPDKVYKVVKALYGLHQAPRAWQKGDILLVQIYVDDIIFGPTNKDLCKAFEKLMKDKIQMSLMGKLTFFLALKAKHWVPNPDDGLTMWKALDPNVPQTSPRQIGMRNLPFSLIPRMLPGVLKMLKTEKRARSYVSMDPGHLLSFEICRLQGLGHNMPIGVSYTNDKIMAIIRRGKHQGNLLGVGRVWLDRARTSLSLDARTLPMSMSSKE